jgi:hypothetical protein
MPRWRPLRTICSMSTVASGGWKMTPGKVAHPSVAATMRASKSGASSSLAATPQIPEWERIAQEMHETAVTSKAAPMPDADALANWIFKSMRQLIDATVARRTRDLETRIAILEAVSAQRSVTATKYLRRDIDLPSKNIFPVRDALRGSRPKNLNTLQSFARRSCPRK